MKIRRGYPVGSSQLKSGTAVKMGAGGDANKLVPCAAATDDALGTVEADYPANTVIADVVLLGGPVFGKFGAAAAPGQRLTIKNDGSLIPVASENQRTVALCIAAANENDMQPIIVVPGLTLAA